jgi:nucleotide-binding universal stress UspA family protein
MKKVIIITDFSSAAHNAAKFGVELASFIGADIILFHAYAVPVSVPDTFYEIDPDELKRTAEEKLLEEAMQLKKSSLQPVEIIAAEGLAASTIAGFASKYNDAIIVCGMKGEGRQTKRFFGSTVTSLVGKSGNALLVIPEDASYAAIKQIALAADFDIETDEHTVDLLQDIAEKYKAKLYIVRVLKDNMNIAAELTNRSEILMHKLKLLNPEYVYPRANDVVKGLEDFAAGHDIQMLVLIPHKHTIFERLFLKSDTRKMIFHTHIPLLILPEVKIHE